MCECIYIYIYICVMSYTYTYTYVYIYIYICICIYPEVPTVPLNRTGPISVFRFPLFEFRVPLFTPFTLVFFVGRRSPAGWALEAMEARRTAASAPSTLTRRDSTPSRQSTLPWPVPGATPSSTFPTTPASRGRQRTAAPGVARRRNSQRSC